MTRYSGEVGFGFTEEDPPDSGTWVTRIVAKDMKGDVGRSTRQLEGSGAVNPDVSLSNSISLVASTYALENYQAIRYAMWKGVRWTVTEVEVRDHRLILSLGEVYNGPTPQPAP